MLNAPELVRTPDSAAGVEFGTLRYASSDGFSVEIWRGVTGRLVVKIRGSPGGITYNRADGLDEALRVADGELADRRGRVAPQMAGRPPPEAA